MLSVPFTTQIEGVGEFFIRFLQRRCHQAGRRSLREEFAKTGLEDFISEYRALPVDEMVRRLIDDVADYSQNAAENDDRAVLAFRVR